MRFPRTLMVMGTTCLLGSARATLAAQAPVKVEVTTSSSHTVWYTDPVWIGIGVALFLLIIVLMIAASRSGKTTTTVIR